jgi:hypothetical protein
MAIPGFKFVDTWKFREAAIYFEQHGCYDDGGVEGTLIYDQYWTEQERRCLEGLTANIGGYDVRISGYHYFYLNFCPIEQVLAVNNGKDKTKRTAAKRFTNFPKFWDLDWIYFTALDIAEYGLPGDTYEEQVAYYESLPLDIDLVLDEDNIGGGKHLLWLKFRGCGASWKGASMPARNFFFIRHSNSYMYADSTQYLTKDGVFTKFELYKNFINLNTPFTKFTDVKNSANEMHIRASHRDLSGNEKGYMSEVMGVTVNGKPDSVRGKRGKVVLFEEFGTFNKGGDVFSVTKSSLEEANLVFGTAILYGTAGIDGKAFETMEKMFYSPKAFGLLRFNNTLDDDLIGTECALFTPADYNVANVDSEGNSNREVTRMFIEKERAIIGKSSDANDAAKAKMEHPLRPGEALLRSNDSILPKAELLAWKTELVASHQSRTAVYGFFEGDTFKPSPDARPIITFPHKKTDVITGCVTVWQSPYKKDGYVPDNLYIVCVDPYMHDSSQGDSLGAAYVIKNINNFSKPDDQIVASFVGRPKTMDEFHRNVEKLARMYNAKIGYENNAGQGLLSYFKSKNLLTMLAKEFELGYNENMPKSTVKRGFGMHIDGYRKKLGISYLADWLTKPWMTDENGVQLYNYHKIYDLGLLEELIKFSEDRNVDRVSAMIIAMFHMKEIEHRLKGPVTDNRKKKIDPFFKTILYKE